MATINFFFENGIVVSGLKKKLLRDELSIYVLLYKRKILNLNFVFCIDQYLLEINKKYLFHNTFTDIITFNNSTTVEKIEGDIFISLERVYDNSIQLETDFTDEFNRVIIHGVLHLIGFSDKTKKETTLMRNAENKFIQQLNVPRGTYKYVSRGTPNECLKNTM